MLVLGLLFWAFRLFPRGHIVRRAAVLATVFIITEGAVGAGLVLFEWVAGNQSVARAVSMAVHLVNTFLLLAAVALTAWWAGAASGKEIMADFRLRLRGHGRAGWLLLGGLALMILLGASGAVTALGDTLFPGGSLAEGISQDFLPTAHFLVRLRIYHPILAVLTGIYLFLAGPRIAVARPGVGALVFSRATQIIVVTQIVAGFMNVLLNVPIWMQLVHLLLADLLWIAVVLLGAAVLSEPVATGQQTSPLKNATKVADYEPGL